jgi:hypothetical protein
MFKNLKRIIDEKIHKNIIITILAYSILSVIIISLTTAFLCGFNTTDFVTRNNINKITEGSETKLLENIVISDSKDPYYPLAQEIAKSENAILINSLEQLYGYYPKYLIWVASPGFLSEKKLLELGEFFKQTQRFAATGIITGLTMESAANLWERGKQAVEGKNYIASDFDINGGLKEGAIIDVSTQSFKENKLNKENLINALEKADYFYWARHVSGKRWFWHKDPGSEDYDSLFAQDIPNLKPVIIHTPSCGSFLPWQENSIAIGFVEKGASAYLGDLFTPGGQSGIFIGELHYLPGKYTWKDFPIGIMTQIQNKSMARASANIPVFFMMGNPKISLQSQKPYEIISDQEYANKRVIKGRWENEGILPLKIDGGASYSYVSIKGLSSISDNGLFYNSKIQSINIQSDKYLLFIPDGSEFEINLTKRAPFLWNFYNSIKDSFEFSLITIGPVQGYISLIFLGIFLLIFLIYKIKKKISLKTCLSVIIAGLIIATLQLIFIIFQSDKVTASSYIKTYPAFKLILGFIGTFSTISGGLILMLSARKRILKLLGMITCVLPQLALTLFYFLFYTITNLQFTMLGFPPVWNYAIVYQFLIVLTIEIIVFICLYFIFARLNLPKIKDKQVC